MIRGFFTGAPGRRRPWVSARVTFATGESSENLNFLIDTGADSTLISPADVAELGLDTRSLPRTASIGVGGRVAMAVAEATLVFDSVTINVPVRMLLPADLRQQSTARAIPSVLGRDVLSRFALYMEERRDLVLLLEPHEADALALP